MLLKLMLSYAQGLPDQQLVDKTRAIAKALTSKEKQQVATIVPKLPLLLPAREPQFWQGPNISVLDHFRREIGSIVHLVDKIEKSKLYTNFTDEIQGELTYYETTIGYASSEAYKDRVNQIINSQKDNLVIHKLIRNIPITSQELDELGKQLFTAGDFATREQFEETLGAKPLGLFIRSLLGLDVNAAKEAFSEFLGIGSLNSLQSNFINKLIELFVKDGVVQPGQLYENQFVDLHEGGLDGVFDEERSDRIVNIIMAINKTAQVG